MKKIIVLLISMFFISSCSLSWWDTLSLEKSIEMPLESENTPEKKDEDIKIEKQRQVLTSVRWLVIKWDYYRRNWNNFLAIEKYIKALERESDNDKIRTKLADLYFEIWEYKQAFSNYYMLKNKNADATKKMLSSFVLSEKNIDDDSIKKLSFGINKMNVNTEIKDFYTISLSCYESFDSCRENFLSYFWEYDISTEDMQNIKKAFERYEKFQIWEEYFINSLIIWEIYKSWLYNLSAILSEKILVDKPNYTPILKIVWWSYFYLWDFEKARNNLKKYYKFSPKDSEIAFLLWEISSSLLDHSASNLYYNVALKNGYNPEEVVLRRLIYNYFILWNDNNLISSFARLLSLPSANSDDFALWIYNSLTNSRLSLAREFIDKALVKFPDDVVFIAYNWWLLRLEWKLEEAEKILQEWAKKNPRNSLLTLNIAYLMQDTWNNVQAKIYFKRTITLNWDWEFWSLAKKELEKMSNNN